jgi:hypothetical protein
VIRAYLFECSDIDPKPVTLETLAQRGSTDDDRIHLSLTTWTTTRFSLFAFGNYTRCPATLTMLATDEHHREA